MTTRDFGADSLDVQAFARAAACIDGADPLGGFARLYAETGGAGADNPVRWQATGELRNPKAVAPQAWLHLRGDTVLPLVCQRCLQPVDVAVEFERSFRFVADERTAEAEDDISEEDVLATRPDLPLRDLIEDEVLLAMPVVPAHAVCPVALPTEVKDPGFDAALDERPHPFAALQAIAHKPVRD